MVMRARRGVGEVVKGRRGRRVGRSRVGGGRAARRAGRREVRKDISFFFGEWRVLWLDGVALGEGWDGEMDGV